MPTTFSNTIMNDGSRHCFDLPMTANYEAVMAHLKQLPDIAKLSLLTDDVTEAWIDFDFQGHHFAINDQHGDYWFFVDDPACPDAILAAVHSHMAQLLSPSTTP